jgi:glucosylceramidase
MTKAKLLIPLACFFVLPAAMHAQTVQEFLTSKDTSDRLTEKAPLTMKPNPEGGTTVFINPDAQFQTIIGFGGAFTESSAIVLGEISATNRTEILKDYFDPKQGIGYSIGRTHIGSCDFSSGNYSYDDTPGDTALKDFSIAHDEKLLLPLIKDSMAIAGSPIKIFSSPWSPPAWMKTNDSMTHGGKLKPEDAQAWADYFVRYVQEYKKQGIDIWGLTVQNEPAAAQSWESCEYSNEEEHAFVRDHLGPTLEKAGMSDIKLMIWDHNYDDSVTYVAPSMIDPATSKYVWGTGVHWYSDEKYDNLAQMHEAWPDKAILFTEGCQEGGPHLNDWKTAERYGRNYVNDLNHWVAGFTDWNIVLDEKGGPNHVGNLCSAPIMADTTNDKILIQPSYYYIGQFSRFIKPGARRIMCVTNRNDLQATAAVNPDGQVVVVVLNLIDKEIRYHLNTTAAGVETSIPGHSIATYVISK